MALHEAAMKDEYFIKRKLAPNVDFWCVPSTYVLCVSKLTLDVGGECLRFELEHFLMAARRVSGLIYRAMGM
jgi:hypothetical protein